MDNTAFNRQVALNWIEAFNSYQLKNLLDLYATDAVHFSPKLKIRQPETNGWISGKPALEAWWADAFERLPTLQYQLTNLIADKNQVLMEYMRKVAGEPDMMVAEILEISNGLINRSRVYHG